MSHPAIGAYFAGLFLHVDYFVHVKTKKVKNEEGEIVEEEEQDDQFHAAAHVVDHIAFTILGPIFFGTDSGSMSAHRINVRAPIAQGSCLIHLVEVCETGRAAKQGLGKIRAETCQVVWYAPESRLSYSDSALATTARPHVRTSARPHVRTAG